MANFSDVAKSGWSTDDGAQTFCVPMACVIHGFIYNKAAFDELGLTPPKTEAEFFAVLDKIKADGTYIPMAMGTNDQWEAATMGYQNIGPNYWKGEEGRLALIKGEQKLTDDALGPALPRDRQVEGLPRRRLRGADLPRQPEPLHPRPRRDLPGRLAGRSRPSAPRSPTPSRWAPSRRRSPNAGDDCYISDHVDIAIGMNAATEAPRGRPRPSSSGSARPSSPSSTPTPCPGFFPLADAPVTLEDPLAQEFVSWRETCKSTIRSTYQILSRGTPEPRERDLERLGQRHPRHRDPRGRREAPPGRPRLLVRAPEELTPACRLAPPALLDRAGGASSFRRTGFMAKHTQAEGRRQAASRKAGDRFATVAAPRAEPKPALDPFATFTEWASEADTRRLCQPLISLRQAAHETPRHQPTRHGLAPAVPPCARSIDARPDLWSERLSRRILAVDIIRPRPPRPGGGRDRRDPPGRPRPDGRRRSQARTAAASALDALRRIGPAEQCLALVGAADSRAEPASVGRGAAA